MDLLLDFCFESFLFDFVLLYVFSRYVLIGFQIQDNYFVFFSGNVIEVRRRVLPQLYVARG